MSISNPGDFAIGIAFLAGGVAIALVASGYPVVPGTIVGAGLFPLITGVAMAVFGGVLALQALRGDPRNLAVEATEDDSAGLAANPPLLNGFALGVVVIIGLATVLMQPLGFIPAGILVSVASIRLSGGSWLSAIIFSPIATLLLFFIFVYAFGVPLPRGILG